MDRESIIMKIAETLYFLWENIDACTAILVSVIVAFFSIWKRTPDLYVSGAILAVLAVLSFAILKTRKVIRALEYAKGAGVFLKDRSDLSSLKQRIASAHDIWFCGISLINVMSQLEEDFKVKLRDEGVNIRLLVIDPKSPAARLAADCTCDTLKGIRSDISRSILRASNIVKNGVGNGTIELRCMKVAPGYSMVLTDPKKYKGRILVEFIGYKSHTRDRPHIELTRQRDCPWYEYFLKQYETLWDNHKNNCLVKAP
ncbi:MAG: hypothetical protein HXS46_13500 [Theionarchaea archaeon]|nr:hypothetical protein [Theionarchaea archaeon]